MPHRLAAALKRSLRAGLARLGLRSSTAHDKRDEDLDVAPPVAGSAALIAELGLIEDDRPAGSYPGWETSRRVVVMDATPRRIEWLRESAPQLELVAPGDIKAAVAMADEADAIIGWYVPEMIARASRLKWLQISAAGAENLIDAPELSGRDILVTNMQKAAGPAIAEHAFALLFAVGRGLRYHADRQKRRIWVPTVPSLKELHSVVGRTLLVVGMGGIGSRIARMGNGLGMRIHAVRARPFPLPDYVDRRGDLPGLSEMVRDADVVVNALPLTAATLRAFDRSAFRNMKRTAIFINVGRGQTVDTHALTECLLQGTISAAALDVVDPEPLPPSHPLWRLSNVLITPHVAGMSMATSQYEWLIKKENLRRFAAGERMLSVVDLRRGY